MIPVILIQITPEERTLSVLFKEESSWKGVKEGDYLKKDKGLFYRSACLRGVKTEVTVIM